MLRSKSSTCVVLNYANRCGKAIRSAISAAALDNNYDPLLALKIVLAAAPSHRRAEVRKRKLDAFFAGDTNCLLAEARKESAIAPATRSQLRRRRNIYGADANAMSALAAKMPGRALRLLTQTGTLPPTEETLAVLKELHPQEPDPIPCKKIVPPSPISTSDVSSALRKMRQSAPGPSGLRPDHLLLAYPSNPPQTLITVLSAICSGTAPHWLSDARLFALPKKT